MGTKRHLTVVDKASSNRKSMLTEQGNSKIEINGLNLEGTQLDRNDTLLSARSNTFDKKSEMSKAEFERQVTALTNSMNNPDLVKSLKDVYGISWENKKMIYI